MCWKGNTWTKRENPSLTCSGSLETDDARQAFKRDRSALRQIGERTKMLRFILEDECALGHVFAMLHAILEHRDGLLVIPDDRGNIILERRQALEFLNREIRED